MEIFFLSATGFIIPHGKRRKYSTCAFHFLSQHNCPRYTPANSESELLRVNADATFFGSLANVGAVEAIRQLNVLEHLIRVSARGR